LSSQVPKQIRLVLLRMDLPNEALTIGSISDIKTGQSYSMFDWETLHILDPH